MQKIGVLLINTGTPDAARYWDVRKYLSQFLSDPRVIDISWLSRFLLLQLIILPFRSKRSAEAYKKIWTDKGSPLLFHSLAYKEKLQDYLGKNFHVELGMRYGNPSIKQAWEKLQDCTQISIFPLFPQYASSSTGSALQEVYSLASTQWNIPTLKNIGPFYKENFYIETFTEHLQKELNKIKWEHLVFSFHGLPQHHIEKSRERGGLGGRGNRRSPKILLPRSMF